MKTDIIHHTASYTIGPTTYLIDRYGPAGQPASLCELLIRSGPTTMIMPIETIDLAALAMMLRDAAVAALAAGQEQVIIQ